VSGDPNPLSVRDAPGSLNPYGVLRRGEAALLRWRRLADILSVGVSIRRGGVRPSVEHFKKRVSDRIRWTPASFRVLTSAKDAGCDDPKKDGHGYFHDRIGFRRTLRTPETIPQNTGFRKRSRKSFFRRARCGTCPRCLAVVIRGHETDPPASHGLRRSGGGAGFCGPRRTSANDRSGT